MKKYQVQLPKKNKLGKLGHIFIEVKIADELYTTIMNSLEEPTNLINKSNNIYDLEMIKLKLLGSDSFLNKLDLNLDNIKELELYSFYQDKAIELTNLRDKKVGYIFNVFTKILTGLKYIRPELEDLKFKIQSLIETKAMINLMQKEK